MKPVSGFTFFEIAISLALVSFGVISVLMLYPIGIKAEEQARLRLFAGAKAEEIIESFSTLANTNPSIEVEAPQTWDVPSGYRPFCPDLEARMVGHRTGIMPVPLDIALRIDSENDEISKILSQGGQLFYSQATGATGIEESGLSKSNETMGTDSLTQRLVFAVVGYAQNNNVPMLAQKSWPYYSAYPSPPGHGENKHRKFNSTWISKPADPMDMAFSYSGTQLALWEGVSSQSGDSDFGPQYATGNLDPDIKPVFTHGFRPYSPYSMDGALQATLQGATQYLQIALWYCQKKGVSATLYDPSIGFDPVNLAKTNANLIKTTIPDKDKWKYVQAFRFLSHAATCMTQWKTLIELGGQPSSSTGVSISSQVFESISSPTLELTHDKIVYYHELCLRLVMYYCASQPYDWAAPRPTQNPLFTDYPLIEYDLFNVNTGLISGTSIPAQQWKPITARPINNIGRSYSFPNTPIPNGPGSAGPNPNSIWGLPDHFTLAKPFAAAERCRELVFWSVDWLNYEDCETAISAPVDASKYLFSAPIPGYDFNKRMNECIWCDHHVYAFRNPEKVISFTNASVPTLPTGSDVSSARIMNADGTNYDRGTSSKNKNMFSGLWGADRNFNNKLDRGRMPKSVRLRATSLVRYNFYDPRLTVILR